MKHKVFKLFVDFEKEERWLNEMSAKGLQFSSYWFGNYVFEQGTPGEYTYRLELMETSPHNAEGQAYIRFMEDAGVECVDTFWRWAYFRKKTADGPFEAVHGQHLEDQALPAHRGGSGYRRDSQRGGLRV